MKSRRMFRLTNEQYHKNRSYCKVQQRVELFVFVEILYGENGTEDNSAPCYESE